MKNLESVEQFHSFKNEGNYVFMFSAGWCPDCRVIEPFMPEVEKKFSNYTFIHVDRDEFLDLCIELNVFGIPSFLAYHSGEEAGRFVSKDRKTQEEIEAFMTKLPA
ncbi:thioredoxin family protein [Jeotgalibacillus soli]|uniref:Thioredoxin n=1 Tax=Jeotgalibacillus soli TaxID=889306 RepID=A0A0C2RQ55_9BACL|nr:thioredoxin family protein [Jeotgalibacillus soli]KIL43889.1 thioredoxin [Jeotgalibacillus soli]